MNALIRSQSISIDIIIYTYTSISTSDDADLSSHIRHIVLRERFAHFETKGGRGRNRGMWGEAFL